MSKRVGSQDSVSTPGFLYGTAWKENETERLVTLALQAGFRGIDTANQRKHYFEAAVGKAVIAAIRGGLVTRNELFLQSKFTFRDGQDHRLPYDPKASVGTQVEQSFQSTLEHFATDWLDSYVLHGPSTHVGLATADWEAWRAMEQIQESGRAKFLGVINVSLDQLRTLIEGVKVLPRFVQNRCYATRGWDRGVRNFCKTNGLVYQGFSLLTANRDVLTHPEVVRIAKLLERTAAQTVFRFALEVGMLPLTGTSNQKHMEADLDVAHFRLSSDEVTFIDGLLSK